MNFLFSALAELSTIYIDLIINVCNLYRFILSIANIALDMVSHP